MANGLCKPLLRPSGVVLCVQALFCLLVVLSTLSINYITGFRIFLSADAGSWGNTHSGYNGGQVTRTRRHDGAKSVGKMCVKMDFARKWYIPDSCGIQAQKLKNLVVICTAGFLLESVFF